MNSVVAYSCFLIGCLGGMLSGQPCPSGELTPGIIGKDDRVKVEEHGPPWDAVGQVNVGGYRRTWRCSGTLVAPNLVITAAHCVMDPWARQPFPSHNIHFLAGVRGPQNKGHATAKCLRFLPDYVFIPPQKILPSLFAQRVQSDALAKDVVAIVLSEGLPIAPAPIAKNLIPQPGLRLVHAAYPADRRYALSAHFDCQLRRAAQPFWFTDCDVHPASSGGAVFTKSEGRLELGAVMVGGTSDFSVAFPSSLWISLTRHATCQ